MAQQNQDPSTLYICLVPMILSFFINQPLYKINPYSPFFFTYVFRRHHTTITMDHYSHSQFLSLPEISPCLLSLAFFFLLLKYSRRTSKTPAQTPPPPGPTKLPIIGNLHQLATSSLPHHRLRHLSQIHGGVMGLQLGQIPYAVISSAESAKQVMKTHDLVFASRPSTTSAQIICYGCSDIAFSPYGAYWRKLRKICALELLNPGRVKTFGPIREEEVSAAVDKLSASAGREFNFSGMVFSLSSGIVSKVAFGKKYQGQDEFLPVVEEMIEAAGGFSLPDLYPSVGWLHMLSGMKARLLRLRKEGDRMMTSIIADHRDRRLDSGGGGGGGGEGVDDLVDVLLKHQEENGEVDIPLTDNSIKAVLQDMFVAGSDTSASTIEWAMSEMVKSPRTLHKAQLEVRTLFNSKQNEVVPIEELLHELHYLKLVIKETLRLHPPAPLLVPRECAEDCEISGFLIKAKTNVIVNVWAIGRDPKYWEDPEEFRPERFMDSSIDLKVSNFEYLPFGAGRRTCPGMGFAMAAIELSLAKFLYHFDWELPRGVKAEDLSMEETFGAAIRRKVNLKLIPIPYEKEQSAF